MKKSRINQEQDRTRRSTFATRIRSLDPLVGPAADQAIEAVRARLRARTLAAGGDARSRTFDRDLSTLDRLLAAQDHALDTALHLQKLIMAEQERVRQDLHEGGGEE